MSFSINVKSTLNQPFGTNFDMSKFWAKTTLTNYLQRARTPTASFTWALPKVRRPNYSALVGTKLKIPECLVSYRPPELTKRGISGTLARIYNLSSSFLPLHCKKSFLIERLASIIKLEELQYMMSLWQNGENGRAIFPSLVAAKAPLAKQQLLIPRLRLPDIWL